MKKNILKRIILSAVFAGMGLLTPLSTVYAVGEDDTQTESEDEDYIDYTGPIDPYTGKPLKEDGEASGEVKRVGVDVTYNNMSRNYNYATNKGSVSCSVADGMVTTESVTLIRSGEIEITLYKDGNKLTEIPAKCREYGSYVVTYWSNNTETQLLSFQIVKQVTGALSRYIMPDGFRVTEVKIDGKKVAHGTDSVDMTQEGDYVIEYLCDANSVSYTLKLSVDHTPPDVSFLGLDDDDTARGPVTVSGLQKGDTVSVIYNDEKGKLDDDNQVSETGYYTVIVTDEAGNTTEKSFRILLYLNINATLFIVAILLVILGVAIALQVSRKKLRVR